MEKFEFYRPCGLLFPVTRTFLMFYRTSPARELGLFPWER